MPGEGQRIAESLKRQTQRWTVHKSATKTYYFDNESLTVQWELPAGAEAKSAGNADVYHFGDTVKQLAFNAPATPTSRADNAGCHVDAEWVMLRASDGRDFFYNCATGLSQWERPERFTGKFWLA